MSWKTIVITPPQFCERECEKICRLIDSGVNYIHLRHPEADIEEFRNILEGLPERYHPHIRLHSHFGLVNEFPIGGLHLNRRWPLAELKSTPLSKSCHSIEELKENDGQGYEYLTLSPIYDSISKEGYKAAFSSEDLSGIGTFTTPVMALGGIKPEHFHFLKGIGFRGAALLGAIWQGDFDRNLDALIGGIEALGKEGV